MSTNVTTTIASNSSCCTTDTIQASLNNFTYSDSTSITDRIVYVGDSIPSNINWGTSIPSIGDVYWNQNDNTVYVYNNATTNDLKEKDNKTMNNNFSFGSYNTNNIKLSLYGMAVKNKAGKWVSYDKESHSLMDVDIFNIDIDSSKVFFKLPKATSKVVAGDIILHNDKPMFVENIRDDGKFEVIDPAEGTAITILPLKSPFGFDYCTVIVSITDCLPAASKSNPFGNLLPLMLSGGNSSAMLYAMMGSHCLEDIDPMLLFALGNSGNLNTFLLMQMMNGKKLGPIFGKEVKDPDDD